MVLQRHFIYIRIVFFSNISSFVAVVVKTIIIYLSKQYCNKILDSIGSAFTNQCSGEGTLLHLTVS